MLPPDINESCYPLARRMSKEKARCYAGLKISLNGAGYSIGGGGGNRTPVRRPYAFGTTCLVTSIIFSTLPADGQAVKIASLLSFNPLRPDSALGDLVYADPCQARGPSRRTSTSGAEAHRLSGESVVVVVGNYFFAVGFTRYSAPRHAPRVS